MLPKPYEADGIVYGSWHDSSAFVIGKRGLRVRPGKPRGVDIHDGYEAVNVADADLPELIKVLERLKEEREAHARP